MTVFKMAKKPRILITAGDPRGIGPEVARKAMADRDIRQLADFLIIHASGQTGFDAIKKAVEILKKGNADGLVTAPVNKSAISKSGIDFKGHTEFLAESTGTKKYVMMLCSGDFRVSVVTRHIALKDVPKSLTKEKIKGTIGLTHSALKKYFGIKDPKIGVCGLNPHCGEGGLMGNEEQEVILPAIKSLSKISNKIIGPIPADVIFYKALKGEFNAIICMYHDQGFGPFKMLAFDRGVNVTLGLPFVRTSPAHGTAYDIAGKNIASPESMKQAIKLAVNMCRKAK